MQQILFPQTQMRLTKIDFSSPHDISSFLLSEIEEILRRNITESVWERMNPEKEALYGRNEAIRTINYLRIRKNVKDKLLKRAICILYNGNECVSNPDRIPSLEGYLSRLQEEFH